MMLKEYALIGMLLMFGGYKYTEGTVVNILNRSAVVAECRALGYAKSRTEPVLVARTSRGDYKIHVRESSEMPRCALVEALNEGDSIRFPVQTNGSIFTKPAMYFDDNRAGAVSSDKIKIIGRAVKTRR